MARSGFAFALAALVAAASAQSTCPSDTIDGTSLIGDWQGYLLSTFSSGDYSSAAMTLSIGESDAGAMTAIMNLTSPSCTGASCPAKIPAVEACIVKFDLTCLSTSHPDIIGFNISGTPPACFTTSSPWRCDYKLTSTFYAESGHGADFFFSARYDTTSPVNPLRLEPFGQFPTGCGASPDMTSLQARATSTASFLLKQ